MTVYRVLVVEDSHEVRRMVSASLQTLGEEIEVMEVPSAEEALFVSTNMPVDLVVLDFRLPGMSGLEMLERLRKRKPETKIILITGIEDSIARQQVAEANAEAYFFKPIDVHAFLEAVKRSLFSTASLESQVPQEEAPPIASSSSVTEVSLPPLPDWILEAARAGTLPPVSAETARTEALPPVPTETAKVEPPPPVPMGTAKAETPPWVADEAAKADFFPALGERLAELKKQLKAVSAMLVNDAGQVVVEAGNAFDIATGSPLLSALMHAFRSSLQVSQALAKGLGESLQYFAAPRQCIYVAPVGLNHALFVVTSGYLGPDRLGMIYHTIHLATRDLREILAQEAANKPAGQGREFLPTQLPTEIAVDQATLKSVEDMFSRPASSGGTDKVESFWETLGEGGSQDGSKGKDVLSYDQARELGLAPDGDKKS